MKDTILFDLDGTLLPMDQEKFLSTYMGHLGRELFEDEGERKRFYGALMAGTDAMLHNDGSRKNEQVFWAVFTERWGEGAQALYPRLEQFYATTFDRASSAVYEQVNRGPLISALRAKGWTVALCTTPVFPAIAVEKRLGWIGLRLEDFALATSYEDYSFCKPSLGYYREVLAALGKEPEQCLMVGNNPVEDGAAARIGIDCLLVTDYLENPTGVDTRWFEQGTFEQIEALLLAMEGPKIQS